MMNKSSLAAMSGTIFECYNYALYGFFAVLLAPLFFPTSNDAVAIILSYCTFAAGYITRPLGGVIFGYIGDKAGRKVALNSTILLAIAPTLMIGLIPSYESIGILAPILLLSCRLLQGLSIGGDYTGTIIFVAEQQGIKNKILLTCILVASGFAGALLGTLVGAICTLPYMPVWTWRLSFIFGALGGLGVYHLRRKMEETHDFITILETKRTVRNPIFSIFKSHFKEFISACIFGGANLVPIYLATVYMNSAYKTILGFSSTEILINNFWMVFLGMALVLASARIIEKYGEVLVIKFCLIWYLLLSVPLYIWAFNNPSHGSLLTLQIFIMIADGPQIAALSIFVPKLFPAEKRYSGLGTGFSIGQAILGGTTPIIAATLVQATKVPWAPGVLLFVVSILYYCAVSLMEKRIKNT